jgi:hypothetical protein
MTDPRLILSGMALVLVLAAAKWLGNVAGVAGF